MAARPRRGPGAGDRVRDTENVTRIRSFVAIDPGADFRSWLAPVTRELAAACGGVRWTRPENVHLTLRFLGDVESEQLNRVLRVVEQAVVEGEDIAGADSLRLALGEAGSFGRPSSPRVFWLGLRETPGLAAVRGVQERLERGVRELGFEPERRRWTPHLTIGRNRGGRVSETWRDRVTAALVSAPELVAGEVTLFSSEPAPGGSIYRVIGSVPLAGSDARTGHAPAAPRSHG